MGRRNHPDAIECQFDLSESEVIKLDAVQYETVELSYVAQAGEWTQNQARGLFRRDDLTKNMVAEGDSTPDTRIMIPLL